MSDPWSELRVQSSPTDKPYWYSDGSAPCRCLLVIFSILSWSVTMSFLWPFNILIAVFRRQVVIIIHRLLLYICQVQEVQWTFSVRQMSSVWTSSRSRISSWRRSSSWRPRKITHLYKMRAGQGDCWWPLQRDLSSRKEYWRRYAFVIWKKDGETLIKIFL